MVSSFFFFLIFFSTPTSATGVPLSAPRYSLSLEKIYSFLSRRSPMCSPLFPRHATRSLSLSLSLSLSSKGKICSFRLSIDCRAYRFTFVRSALSFAVSFRFFPSFFPFLNTLAVHFEKTRVSALCEENRFRFLFVLGTSDQRYRIRPLAT